MNCRNHVSQYKISESQEYMYNYCRENGWHSVCIFKTRTDMNWTIGNTWSHYNLCYGTKSWDLWEILETDICCVFKRYGLPDWRFSFLLFYYTITTNMWKGHLVGKFSQKIKSYSVTWNDNILGLNLLVLRRE